MSQPKLLKRKRKTKQPCDRCGLHLDLCICDQINPISLASRLTLVIHHRETRRTTNTGKLAVHSLTNSEMLIRGLIEQKLNLSEYLDTNYEPLLLYPTDSANELTNTYLEKFSKPIQLIVPDGNWRQASKVHYRHKELSEIPRVFINRPNTSTGDLRLESKHNGMPTLMAIALAFGVLEGQAIHDQLMNLYLSKHKNTTIGRGLSPTIE